MPAWPSPPWPDLLARAMRLARTEIGALAAVAVVALGLWAFASVAEEMAEGETHAFDQAVLNALRVGGDPSVPVGPPWLESALTDLTALGGPWVLVTFAVMAAGFVLIQRRPAAAALIVVSLGGGAVLSQALKAAFGRDRPALAYRAVEAFNPSFPSGHAMLSAVFYLTLGAIMARVLAKRRLKAYVLTWAILLTVTIGFSRIYLGVHWATDVLAGWSLGAAWAMLCWLAAYLLERRAGRKIETT
ncbi:phosphatase PAP2 family protein [Caulobacter sp. 17J65-9]|uniref:phosphatase PAP2 family protein n=1 Tax=Caulobacter sp. 17J65-9 TaxID=2709382 RepID=UPI0013C65442|nr:phosphatase PAP2 family protein [Caulobacter sp. 17J65-9]NEX93039.1 phosphatase PAP2 family protein [Caulobacter sp. 17J65-9]